MHWTGISLISKVAISLLFLHGFLLVTLVLLDGFVWIRDFSRDGLVVNGMFPAADAFAHTLWEISASKQSSLREFCGFQENVDALRRLIGHKITLESHVHPC